MAETRETIALQHWVPNPDNPGFVMHAGNPTYKQVFRALYKALDAEHMIDEYFSTQYDLPVDKSGEQIPDVRWVACWAVTGGSEGHYIHVDLVYPAKDKKSFIHEPFALGKTFQGFDHAWAIAKRIAELLDI